MRRKTSPAIKQGSTRKKNPPQSPLIKEGGQGAAVRRRLLDWYDKNKRDLPWRHREHDPYSQWVVEIMAQQTRIETVIRYYDRFLAKFPNVEALAKARHQDVLKAWEGLGYYRRALHLHQAARELWAQQADIPRTVEGLRELPGIGAYTAAAIASISYGQPVAAVDANVARVVGRLLGMRETSSGFARARIQETAERLLCRKRPGDFNQAWMDLGSRVCQPRTPRCEICPLREYCVSGGNGGAIPKSSKKPKAVEASAAVLLLKHHKSVLVRRRAKGGLWSGLWEFPSIDFATGKAESTIDRIGVEHGLVVPDRPREIGVVRHQLTHKNINFHIFEADAGERVNAGKSSRWVSHQAFERLPVSTAHRRIYKMWMESRSSGGPTGL